MSPTNCSSCRGGAAGEQLFVILPPIVTSFRLWGMRMARASTVAATTVQTATPASWACWLIDCRTRLKCRKLRFVCQMPDIYFEGGVLEVQRRHVWREGERADWDWEEKGNRSLKQFGIDNIFELNEYYKKNMNKLKEQIHCYCWLFQELFIHKHATQHHLPLLFSARSLLPFSQNVG